MLDSNRSLTREISIERAHTLPSRLYLELAVLEVEKDRVFGRTWQLVARTADLSRPGDFVPVELVGKSVAVVRGIEGELRAFSNVGCHLAGQVALGRGNRRTRRAAPRSSSATGRSTSRLPRGLPYPDRPLCAVPRAS